MIMLAVFMGGRGVCVWREVVRRGSSELGQPPAQVGPFAFVGGEFERGLVGGCCLGGVASLRSRSARAAGSRW